MRILGLVPALCLAGMAALASPPDPKVEGATLDLHIIGFLVEHRSGDGDELPDRGLVPVKQLAEALGPVISKRLPLRDPWDRPYLWAFAGPHLVLVSTGPDRLRDVEYGDDSGALLESIESVELLRSIRDDLVMIDGELLRETGPGGAKRTMFDMRSIATAVESFAVDANRYPGAGPGFVPAGVLREALEPVYIKRVPLLDGWGNEFLYVSNEEHYCIVSAGADGSLDRDWPCPPVHDAAREIGAGAQNDPAADIVFADGQFVRWYQPPGTPPEEP